MRFGSLFSGIGGLDLGLERAGMECAWQVEIDDWCRRVLARHWPDVPCFGDIRELIGDELAPVDLICGGFPCQPVSQAGRRLAQADERWLWPEFDRIVRVLRPRYVLVENVPGLLTRGMGDVLGDLAASGYDCEWDCIPAAAVGAPHLRYRVFIVAHRNDGRFEGERLAGLLHGGRSALGNDADGRRGPVPDAESGRRDERRHADGGEPARQWAAVQVEAGRNGGDVVPNAASEGWRPARSIFAGGPQGAGSLGLAARSDWWAVEPDVGRVAHGVPSRVDRLRGLGNAVVPQVAEWIGRRLMEVV